MCLTIFTNKIEKKVKQNTTTKQRNRNQLRYAEAHKKQQKKQDCKKQNETETPKKRNKKVRERKKKITKKTLKKKKRWVEKERTTLRKQKLTKKQACHVSRGRNPLVSKVGEKTDYPTFQNNCKNSHQIKQQESNWIISGFFLRLSRSSTKPCRSPFLLYVKRTCSDLQKTWVP